MNFIWVIMFTNSVENSLRQLVGLKLNKHAILAGKRNDA